MRPKEALNDCTHRTPIGSYGAVFALIAAPGARKQTEFGSFHSEAIVNGGVRGDSTSALSSA
jgi:hypothetical protein